MKLPRAPKRKRKRKPSRHKAVYGSQKWAVFSDRLLTKHAETNYRLPSGRIIRRPWCKWKGKRHKCQQIATTVNHKHAMTDGGDPFDNEFEFFCKSCHQAVTNMEKANRRNKPPKEITPNGLK